MPRVTYGRTGYCDLQTEIEERHEQCAYARRRMLAAIRGWIRERSAPRWTVAFLLVECAAAAIALGLALRRLGLEGEGVVSALAVLAVWPLFLLLLHWRAEAIAQRLDIGERATAFIARDEAETAKDNMPPAPRTEAQEEWRSAVARSSGEALGRTGFALPMLLLLASLTAGTWLLWDLIRLAPHLLSEAVLDGVLAYRHPQLTKNIPTPPWWSTAFAGTAVHFIGLALAALIFAGTLSLLLAAHHHR